MRDVAMMADPVEQLAATKVVIPAPVHVHAAFDVRHHLRRPNPRFVIEFWRWRGNKHLILCLLEIDVTLSAATRQADFNVFYLSDHSVTHDLSRHVEMRLGTLP